MTATIRPATPADVRPLARLTSTCLGTYREWTRPDLPVPDPVEEELDWDVRLARAGAWVRVADDPADGIIAVVAFAPATASRTDSTPVPGLAHVNAVFVDPAHWRQGWARRLLGLAEDAMREQGYERARLWTAEGSPAERLYTALGWTRTGDRDRHPRLGGLTLVKYLKSLRR